jgi:hypothetical protein
MGVAIVDKSVDGKRLGHRLENTLISNLDVRAVDVLVGQYHDFP